MATNQFQKLKASATNYLLSLLIALVSWIGKELYNELKEISSKMEGLSEKVVVHDSQIVELKATLSNNTIQINNLLSLVYEKLPAKHEQIFSLQNIHHEKIDQ